MRYEGDIYRPPGEHRSYLLQATIGCSHNACTFCGMYKAKRYRVRPLDEVLEDIAMAGDYYGSGGVRRVFLCDGDAIALPTADLLTILTALRETFPGLERVTTYAGPKSAMTKSVEELNTLAEAGLTRAYLGIESGDGELLLRRGKGVDAEGMLAAGRRLIDGGMDLWGIVLVGLAGGGSAGVRNARLTAELVNEMAPRHLSAMTYLPQPETPMYAEIQRGEFTPQTPLEALEETRALVEDIRLENLHFTSNHPSNYVALKGTLTRDRDEMLRQLDAGIAGETRIRPEGGRGL